jgi:ribonuclease H2 subunit C
MLAIQKSQDHHGQCMPNILPCRINHDGPVNASKRYWAPIQSKGRLQIINGRMFLTIIQDGKTTAYFRGRKLHGKNVKVPEGYRGVVASSTEEKLPRAFQQGEEEAEQDEDGEVILEVGIIEEKAEFGEVMIWGHEVLPDAVADPYVKGMEEWVAFAEQVRVLRDILLEGGADSFQMHSYSPTTTADGSKST